MTFEDWYGEMEGWGFRCERAIEDTGTNDPPELRRWLEAAFKAGQESERHAKPVILSEEDIERFLKAKPGEIIKVPR